MSETAKEKCYIAIDLKSFYASVECVKRGLDPLGVNLVVADESRTDKTICLAVSPSLKALGVPGRPRLFEAKQRIKEINGARLKKAGEFEGKSYYAEELAKNNKLELDFIVAEPHMADYMAVSSNIYKIYLRYVAPEDMHVYSIDEVFIDATGYLKTYGLTPQGFASKLIHEVLEETGITATAGIGTNLYLCKIAMDIIAKHAPADKDGVRIGTLDEMSYRKLLWNHRPITDFWRVGNGIANRLAAHKMYTMGDVAYCSEIAEDLLYKLFGINAELLIDHAWGWEPCTLEEIKKFKPENNSLTSGQVLHCAYEADKGRLVAREMADVLSLSLVEKGLCADQIVLTVNYDIDNMKAPGRLAAYNGGFAQDRYGRIAPEKAHGTINLGRFTSSGKIITEATCELYDRIVNPNLLVRRLTVVANHVVADIPGLNDEEGCEHLDLFTDYVEKEEKQRKIEEECEKEKKRQLAFIRIQKKYGKNALVKGMNLEEGATTIARNGQVGGHKA